VSSEDTQDADEEVIDALIYFDYFKEIQSSFVLSFGVCVMWDRVSLCNPG
jgi:hypothetical protein